MFGEQQHPEAYHVESGWLFMLKSRVKDLQMYDCQRSVDMDTAQRIIKQTFPQCISQPLKITIPCRNRISPPQSLSQLQLLVDASSTFSPPLSLLRSVPLTRLLAYLISWLFKTLLHPHTFKSSSYSFTGLQIAARDCSVLFLTSQTTLMYITTLTAKGNRF